MSGKKQPLGIYIHVPFCVRKCSYCDFLSFPETELKQFLPEKIMSIYTNCSNEDVKNQYLKMLQKDIDTTVLLPFMGQYEADTVFIGGGTPSSLSEKQLETLCMIVRNMCEKIGKKEIDDMEISMECNPGTLNETKIKILHDFGINRISLGLQSANDNELKMLGRIHRFDDFLHNYELLRKYDFKNINVDLMSALPLQTVESYENTLKTVTALNPEHISAYSLIIEEGTPFYEKYAEDEKLRNEGGQPELLPDEDSERRMYELTEEILNTKGYNRYEISNYAKKGFECRHNIGYWTGKDYISAGIGASSYIEDRRFVKTDNMSHYLNGDFDEYEIVTLDKKMKMEEFMFLGLRMTAGISRKDFADRFNISIDDVYVSQIQKLIGEGLIISDNDNLHLSKKGIDVSNYVFEEFLL